MLRGVTRWPFWAIPARVMVAVLAVEVAAMVAILAGIPAMTPDRSSLLLLLLLGGCAAAHGEASRGIERLRRQLATEVPHIDLGSVWTLAGALLLPGPLAALLVILVNTHLWWRSWRARSPLYRHLFNTATIVLASLAASAVAHISPMTAGPTTDGRGLVIIVLALLAYAAISALLVAGIIVLSDPQADLHTMFGTGDDNLLEIATLSFGGVAALAVTVNPLLIAFVLPPLLVLHRAVLVRHLEVAASTDGKTGLLNAAAWHVQAERALHRARRGDPPRGVLVLDLDHFKNVNDTHGHLAGDSVLAAVADTLRTVVRDRDLVGRFGGEEFVVLIAGLDITATGDLHTVADRIRRRVAALRVEIPTPDGPLTIAGLTISIGAAQHPDTGNDLRTLLQIADAALYAAKRAGRNTVRVGSTLPSLPPTSVRQTVPDSPGTTAAR